ncbi:MAG: TetR/AcrR family transcriptional regulator [Aquiluna sp.]|nr:TetR/AcrR family transcriptional regulator [Aquiluna sp.]MCF8545748.1 TetR/AcrR family transcriptional regulator [Aquiluna sp.]
MTSKSAGRRPQAETSSRDDILRAAKALFMEQGFAKTSMRAVAREAKVDPSLVLHFFTNKEGLFSATINAQETAQTVFQGLSQDNRDEWPRTLAERINKFLSPGYFLETLVIVQRAAASEPSAAALLAKLYKQQFLIEIEKLGLDHFEARATLMSSVTSGLAFTGHVIGLDGFKDAPESLKIQLLQHLIGAILLGPIQD